MQIKFVAAHENNILDLVELGVGLFLPAAEQQEFVLRASDEMHPDDLKPSTLKIVS
jgi:hypothetical protein